MLRQVGCGLGRTAHVPGKTCVFWSAFWSIALLISFARFSPRSAGHLNGDDESGGRLFEWYSDSGGQLKYYPLAKEAQWESQKFRLEPLSEEARVFGLLTKAESYFPNKCRLTI